MQMTRLVYDAPLPRRRNRVALGRVDWLYAGDVGVTMKSNEAIERRRERHREQRRLERANSLTRVERDSVRCGGCGGKVLLPCRLCALRGVK